jgi:hypothetical protein
VQLLKELRKWHHPQDAGPGTDGRRRSKKTGETYPHYERELESLLDSSVIGDPEKTLRHVSKSAGNLSGALKANGIDASPETVRTTLKGLGCGVIGRSTAAELTILTGTRNFST